MVVAPVWLRDVAVGEEGINGALLAMMNIEYPNEGLNNRTALKEAGLSGDQFDYERDVDGKTYRYRLKALRGRGCGYLVAAWTQPQGTNTESILRDALGRITFSAEPPPRLSTTCRSRSRR